MTPGTLHGLTPGIGTLNINYHLTRTSNCPLTKMIGKSDQTGFSAVGFLFTDRLLAAISVFLLLLAPALAWAAPTVVVLDFELRKSDLLPGGGRATDKELRRIRMVAELIRKRLSAEGYEVVTGDDTRAAIKHYNPIQYLHACNGCEREIARLVDADWVIVGWAQIVSYLIQNINVLVLDVSNGERLAQSFVDLRGNTDESFERATRYLLDNLLMERLNSHR